MKAWLLLACLTAGCAPSLSAPYLTLIDQRSFIAPGAAPVLADVKDLPALPLATIRFDTPEVDYRPDLARAVELALSRKPDVEFNVIAPVTPGTAPSDQTNRDAEAVARSIAEQSIPADHIHVGLTEDPTPPPREVRVYVR